MTLFAIYSKPDEGPEAVEAVRQGFSWAAFLVTPVWALLYRAWLVLFAWVGVALTLDVLASAIGSGAAYGLYAVFALWVGFAAPQIRERGFERRGWLAHGEISATSIEGAETIWFERVYGARA
ncbi:DUF2628 domain-containing protein [Pelagibacterium xiamenense]|uniref:DUF2628 domain-containing protein n=1 Tax=Pelagibacterium xiamenense TaxID=2901140 RepID=UPI001E4B3BE8|nr:DUF2628 domain-containing protein [Pelagibacterium xiamenense]MCD7058442.1 DUF2628 domain-containing protein [Pelagibacterium xiamenense]